MFILPSVQPWFVYNVVTFWLWNADDCTLLMSLEKCKHMIFCHTHFKSPSWSALYEQTAQTFHPARLSEKCFIALNYTSLHCIALDCITLHQREDHLSWETSQPTVSGGASMIVKHLHETTILYSVQSSSISQHQATIRPDSSQHQARCSRCRSGDTDTTIPLLGFFLISFLGGTL